MSILARAFTTFLKSRVINYGYHLDRAMVELVKSPLEDPEEGFTEHDAYRFYECQFYSYLAKHYRPNNQYITDAEYKKYEEAVKKFKEFDDLKKFINELGNLMQESETLYIDTQREINTPNLWNRSELVTQTQIHLFEELIQKYIKTCQQLESYPNWQQKVRDEVGYTIHMIYNSLGSNAQFKEMFEKFDKQYFFK